MGNSARIALLFFALALGPAPGARAEEPPGTVRLLVQSAAVAGLRHYAAAAVWPELQVGDALVLLREPENVHDARAVAVAWRGSKLGYVPRRDNGAIAWALDRGQRLQARISRLAPRARRLEFEVFIE